MHALLFDIGVYFLQQCRLLLLSILCILDKITVAVVADKISTVIGLFDNIVFIYPAWIAQLSLQALESCFCFLLCPVTYIRLFLDFFFRFSFFFSLCRRKHIFSDTVYFPLSVMDSSQRCPYFS